MKGACTVHTVPKVSDFPQYNMKCSGENVILRGTFHVISGLPSTFHVISWKFQIWIAFLTVYDLVVYMGYIGHMAWLGHCITAKHMDSYPGKYMYSLVIIIGYRFSLIKQQPDQRFVWRSELKKRLAS